jgi:hypothetical protein
MVPRIFPAPQTIEVPTTKLSKKPTLPKDAFHALPESYAKPHHSQYAQDPYMQVQPPHGRPGLRSVQETNMQALMELQRLRKDLNLDDTPQFLGQEQSHLQRQLESLRMGLANNLKAGNIWDSPPVSGHSPTQWEQLSMLGNYSGNMQESQVPCAGYGSNAARMNFGPIGEKIDMLKYNRPEHGAEGKVPRYDGNSMFAYF